MSHQIDYHRHPIIYHKHLLNLIDNDSFWTEIYNSYTIAVTHRVITHIHCQKLGDFSRMFGEYMSEILAHSTMLIITCCENAQTQFTEYPSTVILKINNKGMDIGGKIIVAQYLRETSVLYDYILMLHSKTNDAIRRNYIKPLIQYLSRFQSNKTIMGVFPPVILSSLYKSIINQDQVTPKLMDKSFSYKNNCQVAEMRDILNIESNFSVFPEGNTYILHRTIIDDLFKWAFYPLLNSETSFDAHWVMYFYKMFDERNQPFDIYYIYKLYQTYNLCGNNIERRISEKYSPSPMNQTDHPDSQFEHIFERVVWNIIQKHNGIVDIAPYSPQSEQNVRIFTDELNYTYFNQFNCVPTVCPLLSQHKRGFVPICQVSAVQLTHPGSKITSKLLNYLRFNPRRQFFFSSDQLNKTDTTIWINHMHAIYKAFNEYPDAPFYLLTEHTKHLHVELINPLIIDILYHFSQQSNIENSICIYLGNKMLQYPLQLVNYSYATTRLFNRGMYMISRTACRKLIDIIENRELNRHISAAYPITQFITSNIDEAYTLDRQVRI
jgi:hypothetical protein